MHVVGETGAADADTERAASTIGDGRGGTLAGAQAGWWRQLGGPNAISLAAWWLTLPGAIVSSPSLARDVAWSETFGWFALGGVGHLLSGIVLYAAWLTVLRPTSRTARPWVFVGAVVVAGMVRGLYMGLESARLGLAESADLVLRMSVAPLLLVIWMSVAALIVDAARRHRTAMQHLQVQLDRERHLASESASRLREARTDIVSKVAETVAVQLQGAAALSDDPHRAAARLQRIVDDVVRPLSHELHRQSVEDDRLLMEARGTGAVTRVPVRDHVDAVVSHRPFAPTLAGAIVLASSTAVSFHALGPVFGALCLFVDVATIVVPTMIARRVLVPRMPHWSLVRRVGAVVGAWLLIAVVNSVSVAALLGLLEGVRSADRRASQAMTLPTVTAVALTVQIALAVQAAVSVRRVQAEQELRAATRAAERALSRLRQRAFVQQQQLSRLLHGEVQARIVSLALQLQINPPADSAAAVADLDRRIRASLSGEGRSSWRDDLDELDEMWNHVIDLSIRIDDPARQQMDVDPSAAQATVAVVREAITNAVRHGGADRVDVSIGLDRDVLVIDVRDDGVVDDSGVEAGIGTRIFDSVCLTWDLSVGNSGRLVASVATGTTEADLVGAQRSSR